MNSEIGLEMCRWFVVPNEKTNKIPKRALLKRSNFDRVRLTLSMDDTRFGYICFCARTSRHETRHFYTRPSV